MTIIHGYTERLKKEKEQYGWISILYDANLKNIEKIRRRFREAGKRMGIKIFTARINNKIVIADRKPKKPKKDEPVAWVFDPVAVSRRMQCFLMNQWIKKCSAHYKGLKIFGVSDKSALYVPFSLKGL